MCPIRLPNLACGTGKWSDRCARAPISLVALDLFSSFKPASAQRRSNTFRTQLLTNGPAFKSLGLPCRREHEHPPPPSISSDFFSPSQVVFCFVQKAPAASWRALSMQQADRWRRLIELLRAGDVERNPGMVRRGFAGRSARAGGDLILHDVQPSTASAYGVKLETFLAYLAPRGFRSLDDCVCGRPEEVATKEWERTDAVQFISALRRHLTWAQARGLPAPTVDTGLACVNRLLKSWQRSQPVECRTPVPPHIASALRHFLQKLGTMLQRLL